MGVRARCQIQTGKEMREEKAGRNVGAPLRALALAGWERPWGRVSQILKEQLRMTRINLSPLLAKMGNTVFILSQSPGTLGLL